MKVSELELNTQNKTCVTDLKGLQYKLLSMDVSDFIVVPVTFGKNNSFNRTINSIIANVYRTHNVIYTSSQNNYVFTIKRVY
jgi:hypothetical protein